MKLMGPYSLYYVLFIKHFQESLIEGCLVSFRHGFLVLLIIIITIDLNWMIRSYTIFPTLILNLSSNAKWPTKEVLKVSQPKSGTSENKSQAIKIINNSCDRTTSSHFSKIRQNLGFLNSWSQPTLKFEVLESHSHKISSYSGLRQDYI